MQHRVAKDEWVGSANLVEPNITGRSGTQNRRVRNRCGTDRDRYESKRSP
jgi:hypothetical protein